MSDQSKITACPHCGRESGYSTKVTMTADRFYDWDGAVCDTDNYSITSEIKYRCSDCGKPVKKFLRDIL